MSVTASSVVPLESGDNLTRAEFHRRYSARPDIHKAELIDGVVYVTTRVTVWHGSANASMVAWLGLYVAYKPTASRGHSAHDLPGCDLRGAAR